MQNRTKGAETRSSKPAIHRKEITLKRNFQKLRESPGVRYESVGRGFESLPSHQEKPEHVCVLVFLFVSTMEGARTGRRRAAPQAISPVGCCLARGFQHVGMSTVEAVNRKISWLFCFVRNIWKIKAVQRPSLPRALCRKKILSLVTFRTQTHGTRSLPPATSLPTAAMKRLSEQTFLRPGCFTVSEIFGIMKNRKKLKRPKREETYGERGI